MRHERWAAFVAWLADEEILQTIDGDYMSAGEIDVGALYTNTLLGGTDRNG
jgi:hypothetical protein